MSESSPERCPHLPPEETGFQCVDCKFVGCGLCISLTTPAAGVNMRLVVVEGSSLDWKFRCKPCAAVQAKLAAAR